MRMLPALSAVLLLFSLGVSAQDDPAKGEKKDGGQDRGKAPTAEELKERREAFYDLCRDKELEWKGWSGKLTVAWTDPIADSTIQRNGTLWVRKTGKDDKRNKVWAPRELAWEVGAEMPNKMGTALEFQILKACTFKENELVRADPRSKIAEKYDMRALDVFFFEWLVRGGLSADLESIFTIRILADPRYHKDTPSADDMKALGYDSVEEMDEEMRKRKARGSGGRETGLDENRPWKDKEDQFDERRLKKDGHERDESTETGTRLAYTIGLTPISRQMKRAVRSVVVFISVDKFLPEKMIIQYPGDRVTIVDIRDYRWLDPDEMEPEELSKFEGKFNLSLDGYQVKEPQKD